MLTLQAKIREPKKDLKELRASGQIPVIFYGLHKDPIALAVSEKEFHKLWRQVGESGTVTLKTSQGELEALIHDVALDPLTGSAIHADFLAVDINKPVQVNVSLEFEGESKAVKNGLGTLVKVMHELHIEALPKDLPQSIIINISKLKTLDDQILVKDVTFPPGVTSVVNEEEVVAIISPVHEEEVEEEKPEVDLSSIEVEKKGKKEEEGEEGSEKQGEGTEQKAGEKKAKK